MGASSLHTELICSPCYSVQSTGPGRWSHLLKKDQRDYSKVDSANDYELDQSFIFFM